MTALKQTLSTAPLGLSFDKLLRDTTGRIRAGWAWHQAYTRTRDELNRLSDRDLADLDIARADINRIAREAADDARSSQ